MASSESNTFEESTSATITANMPIESTPALTQAQNEIPMETDKEISNNANANLAIATQRSNDSNSNDEPHDEDSWWSEVENNDLLLDHVPNVTAVFTPTPEAILEKSISLEESENVLKEENFDRLHKIADKIKIKLNEHAKNKEIEEKAERERKESENSEKENKTGYCDPNDSSTLCAPKEQSLEEFKEELRTKRLQRQNAVQDLRDEIDSLRRQLALERAVNKRLAPGEHVDSTTLPTSQDSDNTFEGAYGIDMSVDEDASSRSRHANIELANAQLALQMANSENISLRNELSVVQKQVVTLKEVIACCKQMLAVKEEQCNEIFR